LRHPVLVAFDKPECGFGLLGFIPKAGIQGKLFFFFYLNKPVIDVKDTS